MTLAPPSYPRIPALVADDDDIAVPPGQVGSWLDQPVVVEEKLDGANVALWLDDGVIRVASRGGRGAMDRAGQLGRLRAWAAERTPALVDLLADNRVAYGEWLWLTHAVRYVRLPDYLVLLDIWSPTAGFAGLDERDELAVQAGLAVPPRVFRGTLETLDRLDELVGQTAWGDERAEGAVLRRDHADGSFDRCKYVVSGFHRRSDEDWRGPRRHNQLKHRTSWP